MYIYIFIYIYIHTCHIYIEREREREWGSQGLVQESDFSSFLCGVCKKNHVVFAGLSCVGAEEYLEFVRAIFSACRAKTSFSVSVCLPPFVWRRVVW